MQNNKKRTLAQNSAIHKYFADVATECQAQGLTLKQVLDEFDIAIDETLIKRMAQHIGKVKYDKSHTSDMTISELGDVIDTLMMVLAKLGLETNFPSADLKSMLETYMSYYQE